MKPEIPNAGVDPLAIMQSFIRTLSLEPAYLKLFGKKNLQIAKFVVEIARSMEPWRFNLASLRDRMIYRLPYSLQRWYVNRFVMSRFDNIVIDRKILMQKKMLQALTEEQCEQVLIIGAGYDTLAFAAAQYFKKVHFFEVDSGTVRDYKIGALAKLFNQVRVNKNGTSIFGDNLHLIECDVNQGGLHRALVNSEFDSKKKTVVLIDELTTPLEKKSIERLMATLTSLLARGSVLCSAKLPKGSNLTVQDSAGDLNQSLSSIYAPIFTSVLAHSESDKTRHRSPDRPSYSNPNSRRPT